MKSSYTVGPAWEDMSPVESPIQALLRVGRAGRAGGQLARYRRLGLVIVLATAIATAVFLGWLARHAGL